MNGKIQSEHLARPAAVYIRQSTLSQVRHNLESTERQYNLRQKALELGWPDSRIQILDGDLGLSGTQSETRKDFQWLVAQVSMGKIGAVLALEVSRLARSSADWHRLLELCAFSATLIIDEDGCYDPADFNDQLLLGLKGTMSQAELHFIRARLQGGKLNKAAKGELRAPLPVGLIYDERGRIVLDPDAEVRHAIQALFDLFKQTGSAYGVVQQFARRGLKFPKRAWGGAWAGQLIWARLDDGRVLSVLKNPAYAGVYVYGRFRHARRLQPDGTLRNVTQRSPMEDWLVTIQDHHEAYITWDQFMEHQRMLEHNRTNAEEMLLSGPAREGRALLQGLLLCGVCGRRLSVRYKGNGGIYPCYECNWLRREALATRACLSLRCDLIDEPIGRRIQEIIWPEQIEIAIGALEEAQRREQAITQQWRLRLERARYETDLAQRRYEQVDPANRLVAATLEQRWEEALVKAEALQREFEAQQQHERVLGPEQKDHLRRLAHDLPSLWNAPTTQARDRKRILRLLVEDITVERLAEPKHFLLHVRWKGGACEDLPLQAPASKADQIRTPAAVTEQIRQWAPTMSDLQIAEQLNRQGVCSATGRSFTQFMIRWLRYRHAMGCVSLKRPEELTVAQVAARLEVSPWVVYYWVEHQMLPARRINHGSPLWITLDEPTEEMLRKKVRSSTKIQAQRAKHA